MKYKSNKIQVFSINKALLVEFLFGSAFWDTFQLPMRWEGRGETMEQDTR